MFSLGFPQFAARGAHDVFFAFVKQIRLKVCFSSVLVFNDFSGSYCALYFRYDVLPERTVAVEHSLFGDSQLSPTVASRCGERLP